MEVEVLQSSDIIFNLLKAVSMSSTSITYWPPSTSWKLYQRIVILLLQSHTDHLQQVKIISEDCNTSTSIPLVEGGQYVIEVEVLQSSDIIFTCWRRSGWDWSRSITILWYNLQLVEGGQYVIEVEVLQSFYIIFNLLKAVSMGLK
jgi:hypothetical protein